MKFRLEVILIFTLYENLNKEFTVIIRLIITQL